MQDIEKTIDFNREIIMKHKTISGLLMTTLFLGGCSFESGPPQAAIDVAVKQVKENKYSGYSSCSQSRKFECTDFSVGFATKKDLTPADKKNGINEKFDIRISYLFRDKGANKWEDNHWRCVTVANTNDKWAVSDWHSDIDHEKQICLYR